jgi:predicted nucleic acid-binding protein
MAKLTDEESKLLKRLTDKQKAPDEPSIGKSLNISIDLGDEAQVARAQKLGLLAAFTGDDDDENDDDDKGGGNDDDGSDPPKRRGFFPS